MSALTFDVAFERLIGHEGKFTDDPKDRGNWTTGVIGKGELRGTKYGISAMTYPYLNINDITLDYAKKLYKRDWWDALSAESIDGAIVYQIWDFAINSSMATAKRKLQQAIDVADDGIIGPVTLQKINSMDVNDVLMRLNALRLMYMTSLSTWGIYGKGWARRIAQNLNYAATDN